MLHFYVCTVVADVTCSVRAQLTLIWLLASVGAYMLLQVFIAGSPVITVWAGVWPIASVGGEVSTELLPAGGHKGTLGTSGKSETVNETKL